MPGFAPSLSTIASHPEVAAVIALAVIAALYGIWWSWWQLPKRQVNHLALKIRDPKARADVEDSIRKTVGQALGGLAVLLGAMFALFQFLEQQKAAHDLLISNQVSKGFEQLASKELFMQLGGIYALEGVMNTSDQYRVSVLEALCAFVREKTKGVPEIDQPPTTQVQAALTVIGRRTKGRGQVDLLEVRIPNADLGGANLIDAELGGSILIQANLTGADLTNANLKNAKLYGADLSKADLTRAVVEQFQLDEACGADVKLTPTLTVKACSELSSFNRRQ
jgi:hypothetical protein